MFQKTIGGGRSWVCRDGLGGVYCGMSGCDMSGKFCFVKVSIKSIINKEAMAILAKYFS